MSNRHSQPWLHSAALDIIFILSPPFVALLIVMALPQYFQSDAIVSPYYWLFLVVFIDVAHVYSTLYRTYFSPGWYHKGVYLTIVPLACYIAGVLIYSLDGFLFWRILAYLAIFHFIRQQYGFMSLYSRKESATGAFKPINTIAIYTATLYPLLYWHLDGNRKFNWFVEDDVMTVDSPIFLSLGKVIYLCIIALYLTKELWIVYRIRQLNVPRNLLIFGTFLSWYFGIVFFNGDMAFTTLNVVSHGIPYIALIWVFEKKKYQITNVKKNWITVLTFEKLGGVLFFLLSIALFAYLEEGLWDGIIWKEHKGIFPAFSGLPTITNHHILSLLVPLLALPQSTHYVLDGFIWKKKASGLS